MIFHFASFVTCGRCCCCCWTDFIWTTNKKRISVETLLPPSFAHTHSMHIGCTSPFYFVVVLCTIALHNSCVSVCVLCWQFWQSRNTLFSLCQSISVCWLVFAASNRSFFTLSLSPCVWDSLWIDNANLTIDLFTSDLFRCFAGWFFTFSFKCVRVNLV